MTSKKAPKSEDIHVGQRVRMRRMMLGMSQEKLGDALGITFQQIQKYEKGTNRIGASRLVEISRKLNVSISFFFDGLESASQMSAGDQALMQTANVPGCIELVRGYEQLSPTGRKAILLSMNALLETTVPTSTAAAA
ncbi:transcriptional regulator with XRE-family HTH domain [Labrenzia sp. EL_126]|nr:transcriptional regulator with XRE-family HTH domain [Labrenzia sp. EL_126]